MCFVWLIQDYRFQLQPPTTLKKQLKQIKLTKCCSSFTGAVDGPGGDDAIVCVGENGVLVSGGEQGVCNNIW